MRWKLPLACLLVGLLICHAAHAADWPTYRGNAGRTGNVDNQPGPSKPRVLWAYGVKENFVGSPSVVADDLVCAAALGAFNSGSVVALESGANEKKLSWSKGPPLLKLPVVASPIFSEGVVLFGDGMHQTDGAILRGVAAATGRLLWQHSVPGKLVHMEGAAVVGNGKVYIGAGHGGVICLDPSHLSINGEEASTAEIREKIDAQWQKLQAAYEKDKLADPDFAVPPSEDSLPKAAPRLVWQVGAEKLHVDAPLALAGDKLLAASAYLDVEKTGERALVCFAAKDGELLWKCPLDFNPWAGATVDGELAILGCSNIRLDPKELRKARGALLGVNLADGSVKWKKTMPAGIVSSVAVKNGLAVACCTDGKVRAYEAASGEIKWTYDATSPLFAGPAIAGDVIYAGDLKAVVHAISLTGKEVWKFDLNASGATKNAMIYGAPIVHGGRIFVGTCNLESSAGGQQALVCLGQ